MGASQDLTQAASGASLPAHTPEEWEPVADEVLSSISERMERGLQSLTDDIYERLLYAVQDNLIDNARFNIGSRIESADRQARSDRLALQKAEETIASLLSALTGLREMMSVAESNASGNPEWEYVSGRINAARAAIAKATSQ